MQNISDFQLWKSARLVKPTRTLIFDITLGLGGDYTLIENIETELKQQFLNQLNLQDLNRFCLFKILVKIRDRGCELFFSKLLTTFNNLGYTDIKYILY